MAELIQLAPHVWRVPTTPRDMVNSFMFEQADGSLTLVDTGVKGMAPKRIAAAIAAAGRQPADVRRILLTHAHADHAGGVARVQRMTGGDVANHDDEARWVRDGRPPPPNRHTVLGRVANLLPARLEPCEVRSTFRDGELLDVAGGLRVLHTPGHTMGHCSFLHEPSGVLITGDSLFNWFDRMRWSYKLFCTDFPLSKQTAERLGEVDYEVVAFTHGREIRSGAREKVREFLRTHSSR
jgi:glyoxylase-like metal-dependent hydrolase (beta-lactamase superfamily II)